MNYTWFKTFQMCLLDANIDILLLIPTEDKTLYVVRCAEACNFTKINTTPWVFFTFF